ncbi:MAG TPA: adenylate/guanylate cyclase domain-containing protein [Burkholderiaceae bacterium]|nr:adenylate/guanylate cyclase domain-containing protein [Burkholderiaceae bacterium]
MPVDRATLLAGIAALEAQRPALGDAAVDAAIAALRASASAGGGDAPLAPGQALRQVTILFLDVVGSTALSRRLDPEEVHAVMDGALARCTVIVERHQGRVLQYAGDNLLAAFGADRSREDDAERAVRCGLALLAEGRRLGADVLARHGHAGFDVRVGVHTGEVLLGGGVDADGSIRGTAVNVAARMEQSAPAGGLRISSDTFGHVRGRFEAEPQLPIEVKGVEGPVATYLVRGEREPTFRGTPRGVEGVRTPMVGRGAELALLQQGWRDTVARSGLRVIAIVGEAGVGKSRLLHEFDDWARQHGERARVFRGRALQSTQGEPYGLLRDIIAARLQIGDGDSLEEARAKIEAGIVPLFERHVGADLAQAQAHLLGHLIGIDFGASPHVRGLQGDARQLRDRAFHAAAQIVGLAAQAGGGNRSLPLMMQLEDLHWADDGSLDFLQHLLRVGEDLPLLLIALARPALDERRADWLGASDAGGPMRRRVELAALDALASRELAAQLLRTVPAVPAGLDERIAARAQGNPFYIEELVKMLLERGAIGAGADGATRPAEALLAAELPQSLTGVLQARLDALPARERRALRSASVIGAVFWDRALAAVDARAPEALPALVQRRLALARPQADFDGVREYAFEHQILHRVTYATLLRRVRRVLHARAAAWLAGIGGARASDFLAATAEHYALAGNDAQAVVFFTRAAEHARQRYAQDLALSHTARALELLDAGDAAVALGPQADALRWRLLTVREYALSLLGRRAEQRAALDAMGEVAHALADDARRAWVAQRRSMYAMRVADSRAQEAAAREAVALAERSGDDDSRLRAQRLVADALGAQGRLDEGAALARAGLEEAGALGLRRVEAQFLNVLSFIANQRDDQVAGLSYDLRDLQIWRQIGDRHGEAVALGNVGADWLWFGDLEQARRCLEDTLRLCRAIGARSLQCASLGNLSQARLYAGDAAAALALGSDAAVLAAQVLAADFEAAAQLRIGDAQLALARPRAALESYERAEDIARRIDHPLQIDARTSRVRAALELGELDAAQREAASLFALSAEPGALDGADARLLLFTCHRAFARTGDARAGPALAAAHEGLQRVAATISDAALRESFLSRVPSHREIVEAWAARAASPLPSADG